MVTIAGTGSGKTTGALIPNLCVHRGSLLCIDPVGELAVVTAARRGQGGNGVRGLGQKVFVLDPFRIVSGWQSSSYNVFDELAAVGARDIDAPASYAEKIVEALMIEDLSSSDKIWDHWAASFLKALILYVSSGPKEKRTLVHFRDLVMGGEHDLHRRGIASGQLDPRAGDAFDLLLDKMADAPPGPFQHIVAGAGEDFSTISRKSERQFTGILSTVRAHTSFLESPGIRRVSQRSDFLLEDLKKQRISVYLCMPLTEMSGNEKRWLRMFTILFTDMAIRVLERPEPPVLLAIDEFPALGFMKSVATIGPQLRKYRVRLWVAGQHIEQFKTLYPNAWQGFLSDAVQFMAINDTETVEWLAHRLGPHVVKERSPRTGEETLTEYPLLDPNQVSKVLAPDRLVQIVHRGNQNPLMLKICRYFDYMPWWYYSPSSDHREKFRRWFWRRLFGRRRPPLGQGRAPEGPPDRPAKEKPEEPVAHHAPIAKPQAQPEKMAGQQPGPWTTEERDFLLGLMREREQKDRQRLAREKPSPRQQAPVETQKPRESKPQAPAVETRPATPSKETDAAPQGREEAPNSKQDETDPMQELEALIGLRPVKEQVKKTANLLKLGKARAKFGMASPGVTHHLIFTGNPGTGKTTVARIVGRIYRQLGVLKKGQVVEAARSDLVAGYVGHTALKVRDVVDKATDGILFIDEAYSLASQRSAPGHDFGKEAVDELVKLMEDRRERLIVIVAGYKAEMAQFIQSNPGLVSRFKTTIDFPDYDDVELFEIFESLCAQAQLRLSVDAMVRVSELIAHLDRGKGFGNGRTMRNLFEECFALQAARLAARGRYGKQDLTMLEADDIPALSDTKP
jgi:AAA+ superfamily predicted ATPase